MTNEAEYRKEWATLTGRPESDIYIPEAIRDAASDRDEAANGQPLSEDREV